MRELSSIVYGLAADGKIREQDDDFLGAHDLSTVSSNDGNLLFDPPPAYRPLQQNFLGALNCQ